MDKKEVTDQDLAQAFGVAENIGSTEPTRQAKPKKHTGVKKSPKLLLSIIMLVMGSAVLIAGVVWLILDLTRGPVVADGEFLMLAKEWVLDERTNCASGAAEVEAASSDSETVVSAGEKVVIETNAEADGVGATNCISTPSVIWQFTEVGKGTLTTNNHINDYDFIWALEDGRLKIETKWLYDLENEYEYELNQADKTLILKDDDKEIVFVGHFAETE